MVKGLFNIPQGLLSIPQERGFIFNA